MIGMTLAAASLPGSYDCTIERQAVVTETGVQPGNAVEFPGTERDAWRFRVRVPRDQTADVSIEWAANPIQIAGRHPPISLAPGQIAFAVPARGPCMFTERNCLALVELSAREDGDLTFSILPAGSIRHENGTRSIFHVVFVGICRRQDGA